MRAVTTPMRALRRSLRASVRQAKATQAMEMGLSTRREMHATCMATMAKKTANEANEAMLMQQMLDAMSLGDEKDESENAAQETHQPRQAGLVTLPVTGVVLDVKNNIAAISGLRHATLGSVVAVYNCSETEEDDLDANDRICRGVVLFLEKKVAHVALFREAGQIDAIKNVQIGMQVRLEDQELRVPVSLGRMTGRAVNPLGEPIELVYDKAHEPLADEVVPSANDHVSIAWGSKTVPGLMTRGPLREPFATGVLAIDCLKPLAFGHRFGILGPRNSGKTRLVLDIIAQQVKLAKEAGQEPPHFVYVSVGKSPTRVQQILQFLEQTEALVHTTIVSADERDSLIMQYLAPFSGCAIAEYFMKNSKSKQSVVVYDDLATHTTVVESLVQTMKLPKVSQLSLSAHTVLMERSAQFLKPTPSSVTAFALADTPDSATGEVSEFMERMKSIVDDSVVLEAQMARSRVYPPIDVLMPGSSVRGPPFQSVPVWTYMNRVRSRINESSAAKEGIDVSISLGLEVEPEDAEVLEFQELVRQFFAQQPLKNLSKAEKELGVFFLATIRMALLPPQTTMDDLVREALELLCEENPELLHLVEAHPTDKKWSRETEEQLEKVLLQALAVLRRKQQEAARSGKTPMLPAAVLRRLGRI